MFEAEYSVSSHKQISVNSIFSVWIRDCHHSKFLLLSIAITFKNSISHLYGFLVFEIIPNRIYF